MKNKKVMRKKIEFWRTNKIKIVLIFYNFIIKGSSVVLFDISVLANINWWEKYKENKKKSQKLKKFPLN